jgi:tetratricopeptide (TPR) repeat protein
VTTDLIRFPRKSVLSTQEAALAVGRIVRVPIDQRAHESDELGLEDPEVLLSICQYLRDRFETSPLSVREEAVFFYRFLQEPARPIGSFDERDYYLGEFALIAGTACRFLALRDESRRWFDLAEANFVLAHNASAHFARLAYQRLALRIEERDFGQVLTLAPQWVTAFRRLELPEDALKCRFLEAIALKETERFDEAKKTLEDIRNDAVLVKNDRLAAIASQNLFQLHSFLGQADHAIAVAQEIIPVFKRLDNRVGLAKLQLGLGYLFRSQLRLSDAVEAYRTAQGEFRQLGMHADVAGTHLVLADLLLDTGQPAQAEWEIRAALPVIDELKLVPEGIAALSLLRDSLRRRQIDRQALRNLNGYFEELGS